MSDRRIEREFGVPVAGEILPPEQWTRTALKKLPPEGPLDWSALFGRVAPLVIDIGCGNGRFLIGSCNLVATTANVEQGGFYQLAGQDL